MVRIKTMQAIGYLAEDKKVTVFKSSSVYKLRIDLSKKNIACDLSGAAIQTIAYENPNMFKVSYQELKILDHATFLKYIKTKRVLETLPPEAKVVLNSYEE